MTTRDPDAPAPGVAEPPAPEPRRWRRRLALAGLASLALYVALAVAADARATADALARFSWATFALACLLSVAAYAIRAARWHIYLRRLGVYAPDAEPALGLTAGFTMGLASGKLGQVIKAYYLRLATGMPYTLAIPAVVAERMADAASILLLLALGVLVAPGAGAFAPAALAAVPLVWLALRSRAVARGLVRGLSRVPALRRHAAAALEGHERTREHLAPRPLALPALVGLLAFLAEALGMWWLARGLGHDVAYGVCVLVLALADVAGMLSLIPGGLGAAEGSLVVLLATLGGMDVAAATALTLLFRVATLWLGVGLSVLAAALLHARHAPPAARRRPAQG